MCDSFVAVTGDGLLFAKNSDRDPNESQLLEWHPAADHPAGASLSCTWADVPQVAHTHAVVLSRPWWMWGAEMGANEHGVVIGNEAVVTRGTGGETALLGMDLLRLALERARTAHGAVSVMVDLLERHGQGGPCSHTRPGFTYDSSFMVADPTGGMVVETAGRHWATEEVRGPGRSISNGLTIPSFASVHATRRRSWTVAATTRRRITESMACRARAPDDMMRALRDHGSTPVPRWSRVHGGLEAPCVHAGGILVSSQTTAAWVSDLRSGGPRHWVTATGAPCTSLFKPVAVDQPVDLGPAPTSLFDDRGLWWRHERLHRAVLRDSRTLLPLYAGQRDRVEADWLAAPPRSTVAFAEADRLEREWRSVVGAAGSDDRRPWWVRRAWRSIDRDAAFVGDPGR